MPTPVQPEPTPDYQQHLEIETPENVVLDLQIAGVGSRMMAFLLDLLVITISLLALQVTLLLAGLIGAGAGRAGAILMFLAGSFGTLGYFVFFEGLREGQTPGKRRLGIRVISDTGHGIGFGAALLRNLLLIADFFPPPFLTGLALVALQPRGKRLGDLVAGTIVVRDRPSDAPASAPAPAAQPSDELAAPQLSDDEFRLLDQFRARAASLDATARARIETGLLERLADRLEGTRGNTAQRLESLFQEERARRQGLVALRTAGTGTAQRFAARKQARWDEFEAQARRASARGLDALGPDELLQFAARYREVAADLARARTYRAGPATILRLERLVTAGHNLLYREERGALRRLCDVLSRECPAAVVDARSYVLIAFLVFAVPAGAGYTLLRERPALAEEVVPEVMLERAEAAPQRIAQGKGYVTVGGTERPAMATFIITNNIRVAFTCFAGGIFLGVGSLILLAFNGLQLGTAAGHFANLGLLGYLMQFVVGHGVLELFSIWVAGAAGFLLGRTVIAPGDLARGDALVLAGRQAVRMIGAVVVLLCVAGLIEGLVSSASGGWTLQVGVSAASFLFLMAYLFNGVRSRPAALSRPAESPASGSPAPPSLATPFAAPHRTAPR